MHFPKFLNSLVNPPRFFRSIILIAIAVSAAAVSAAYAMDVRAESISAVFLRLAGFTGAAPTATVNVAAKNELGNLAPQLAPLTGDLATGRTGHTATLLADGRVLVAGGDSGGTAEIYDPVADSFSATGSMTAARYGHTASRLADGRVLVTGGTVGGSAVSTTEIYDPATGTFSIAPSMNAARSGHTATTLGNGRLVVVGGDASGSIEIYDPASNTFSSIPTTLTSPRSGHGAALLSTGNILIAGGTAPDGSFVHSGEIINLADGSITAVSNPTEDEHIRPLMRVLSDGKVQVIGGTDHADMEIYDPAINAFGAHSHVFPIGDSHPELVQQITDAATRSALFYHGASGTLLDREGQTITELPALNKALVVGGTDGSGNVLSSSSLVNSSPASITTDKLDYAPGTPVVVTGTGFAPNETVTLTFHEDPHPSTENPHTFTVTTDANGNFTDQQYAPEDSDVGVAYILAAVGGTSGYSAQTALADASLNSATITVKKGDCATNSTSFGFNDSVCGSVLVSVGGGGTNPDLVIEWFDPSSSTTPVRTITKPGVSNGSTQTDFFTVTTLGTWTIKACKNTGCSGGNFLDSKTFTVAKADQTILFGSLGNKTYGDASFTVSATGGASGNPVTFSSTTATICMTGGTNGTTITIVKAGNCTIRASQAGNANYNAAADVDQSFTVNKAGLTVTADDQAITYGDNDPVFTFHYGTFVLGQNSSVIVTPPTCGVSGAHTDAGNYPIVCSGGADDNYTFSYVNGMLTVNKAHLTVTADDKTREYGDANPTFTVTVSGFKLSQNLLSSGVTGAASCSSTAGATSPASPPTYPITCSVGSLAASNYDFPAGNFVGGNLTITKATLTVTADNKTREYGDANPAFTASYSGFKNGENFGNSGVAGAPSLTTTATPTSAVPGPYAITATLGTLAANNYQFSFTNGVLTITKAHLTVTADNASREYGDSNPTFTSTITGYKNAETLATSGVAGSAACTSAATTASSVAGSPYAIHCLVGTLTAGNYDFPTFVDGVLAITKAHLTVTADNKSREYGDTEPTFTYGLSGFKNLETDITATGLSGAASCTTTATQGSTASPPTYPINCTAGTLMADNYDFTNFVAGVLIITKAHLSVTGQNASRVYGDPNPTFTATITGFKNLETLGTSGVTGLADSTSAAIATSHVSPPTYAIVCAIGTLSGGNNYDFPAGNFNDGQLTITPRPAAWTTNPASKTYGDPDPSPLTTGSGSNFLAADNVSATYARTLGETVGGSPYHITATLGTTNDLANYSITNNGADFTISKATLGVNAVAASKTYGQSDPTFTFTLSGFKFTDDGSVASGTASCSRNAGENVGGGPYTITCMPGTLSAANYNFATGATAAFVINKADATISVTPYNVTYNGASHTATGSATGVASELLSGLDLSGTTHTNAGDYLNDPWTFTDGTGNYNDASGSIHDHIDKANATISVIGFSGPYDGLAHGVISSSATGLSNEALSGLVADPTTYTDVPGGLVHWTFTNTNYNDQSGSAPVTITQATSTTTLTCSPASLTYTGSPLEPCSVSVTGANLNLTFAPNYSDNVNVGTATAGYSYAGDINHTGSSGSATFAITKASSTTTITCPISVVYNGIAQTPCTASVTGAGGLSTSVSVLYGNNTNAGTATANASFGGDSNHDGSTATQVTFQIMKANAVCTVTGYHETFDANPHTATGACLGVDSLPLAGLDLSGTTHTGAGDYTDSWTFTDVTNNYNNTGGSVSDKIVKKGLVITASSHTVTYGAPTPTVSVASYDSFAVGENASNLLSPAVCGTTYSQGSGVGNYPTTCSGAASNDYEITYVGGSVTVGQLTVTVTPDSGQFKTYGDGDPVFSYGSAASLVAGDSFSGALSRVTGSNVGLYNITQGTLSLNSNYVLQFTTGIQFEVKKRSLTASIIGNPTKVYDGTTNATLTPANFSLSNLVGTESFTVTKSSGIYNNASVPTATAVNTMLAAGDFTAGTGTLVGNYNLPTSASGPGAITKASLSITASSHTIFFNSSVPIITPNYAGFVASENPSNLSAQPTCSTTYTIGSSIGTYPSSCTGAASDNYNIGYTPGVVTVVSGCSVFNGFLSPIGGAVELNTGGSFASPLRTFKLNSTIPVKWSATCFGSPLLTGVHTLQAIKYSSATSVIGDPIDATPTDAATTGNQFRLTDSEWHFNLDTKKTQGMGEGVWLLKATLYDGSTYSAWISIKK